MSAQPPDEQTLDDLGEGTRGVGGGLDCGQPPATRCPPRPSTPSCTLLASPECGQPGRSWLRGRCPPRAPLPALGPSPWGWKEGPTARTPRDARDMTRRAGPAGRPLPGQGEAPLPGRQEASGLLGLGAVRPGAWGLAGWGADGRPRAARLHRDESPLPSHRGPGRRWAQRSGCRAGVGAGEVGGNGGHGAQPGAAVGGVGADRGAAQPSAAEKLGRA